MARATRNTEIDELIPKVRLSIRDFNGTVQDVIKRLTAAESAGKSLGYRDVRILATAYLDDEDELEIDVWGTRGLRVDELEKMKQAALAARRARAALKKRQEEDERALFERLKKKYEQADN